MFKFSGCEWDEANFAHLARHQVEPDEAEEALVIDPHIRRARADRYLAYGPTADGRHLVVVFRYGGKGVVRVVTAREMTKREKGLYRQRRQR